jgi:hypothetical protein
MALAPATQSGVARLHHDAASDPRRFHLDDALWARIVLDFAVAYRNNPLTRGQILRSLTPLYLARVASFVIETEPMTASEVEQRIESLCMVFEELKPYLASRWDDATSEPEAGGTRVPSEINQEA